MENKDAYEELSSIKNIMERSTRFISLSGLSGIMAGIYALIGAAFAYILIPIYSSINFYEVFVNHNTNIGLSFDSPLSIKQAYIFLGFSVLILSLSTGIWLTRRKANRKGQTVWNQSSRALIESGIPSILTGACCILILLSQGYYGIVAPACLIFYGLALVAASKYTYGDVKWLGMLDIGLGLLALLFPFYGLLFWALGFGVLHILYGTIMYFKYDRENSAG